MVTKKLIQDTVSVMLEQASFKFPVLSLINWRFVTIPQTKETSRDYYTEKTIEVVTRRNLTKNWNAKDSGYSVL